MTQAQSFSQDVRRHADGSIDFDFYRVRATALRRQAMQDGFTLKSVCAGALTMLGPHRLPPRGGGAHGCAERPCGGGAGQRGADPVIEDR